MRVVEAVAVQPREVSRVRHAVAHALDDWGVRHDESDVAVLLTSELVTNAIRYGGPPVVVHVCLDDLALVVAVDDAEATTAQELAPVARVPWYATGGRGLHLVESLSHRWGVDEQDGGKRVWFELRLGA